METPAAAPMGLACQSLLVRDDGGGVRHPFQYGGAGPTSASELKHRISRVVSKADHAMLRKGSMDFGCGLADRRREIAVILLSLVYGAITFHQTNVPPSV